MHHFQPLSHLVSQKYLSQAKIKRRDEMLQCGNKNVTLIQTKQGHHRLCWHLPPGVLTPHPHCVILYLPLHIGIWTHCCWYSSCSCSFAILTTSIRLNKVYYSEWTGTCSFNRLCHTNCVYWISSFFLACYLIFYYCYFILRKTLSKLTLCKLSYSAVALLQSHPTNVLHEVSIYLSSIYYI